MQFYEESMDYNPETGEGQFFGWEIAIARSIRMYCL